MIKTRLIFYIAALFLLESCASMSKSQCVTADWRTVGFEDGAQGLPAGQIAEYRRDCAKYGITPNLNVYLAGRSQGLAQYCRAGNGLRIGESGGLYDGVCPKDLEGEFLSGYRTGRHLFVLRAAVNNVTYQLADRHRKLKQIDRRIAEKTAAVIDAKTSTRKRVELLLDITRLTDRKHHIRHEMRSLRRDREARLADLVAFQRDLQGR